MLMGVFAHRIWQLRRSSVDAIEYKILGRFPNCPDDDDIAVLRDYFQLDLLNLKELYDQWTACDARFAELLSTEDGMRLYRDDRMLYHGPCSH